MSSTVLNELTSQLQQISSQPNAARSAAYARLLTELLTKDISQLDGPALQQACSVYLQHAVFSEQNSTGGGLIVGRNALTAFEQHIARIARNAAAAKASEQNESMQDIDAEKAGKSALCDPDVCRQVLEDALDQVQARVLSFEEQASNLRLQLAGLLESEEEWNEAARVLLAIPLDSGHRTVSDHFKLSIYVRIVRLLLEADDPVQADLYLKRASMVIRNVPGALPSSAQRTAEAEAEAEAEANASSSLEAASESSASASLEDAKVLGLQFRLSQARIYDSQRRFAEAAVRYHELSFMSEIDEDDRSMMLSAAVTASILSPAGPQRARTLATLMRDERTQSLPQYTILSKVFLDHIIRPDEIAAFEKLLSPHQVAKLAPSNDPVIRMQTSASDSASGVRHAPLTVLDRAMIEHNVLSASRLYDNITLDGLGALVNLSAEGAEATARRMIMQGRLKAWIDQVGDASESGVDSRSGVDSATASRGMLFFLDQGRRAENEITAGGLSASAKAEAAFDGDDASAMNAPTSGQGDLDAKWTRRWDEQISRLTDALEDVCQHLNKKGLSSSAVAAGV
ncbi:hypothetical protein BCV70DRAFT_83244 [Testicularia cyperi]|uniref:COP9 signalosome complex subunit 4 n=1 Tax=Testicularia cyperi TaxID=1882483 RepID=A0A317XRA4_9BASI|nr:hypothetical protein BCV70DRAFT_83244 [Testicularia cyperi]